MLTIQQIDMSKRFGNSGAGVVEYLCASEYYLDADGQEHSPSQWIGKGAQALGLTGAVTPEALTASLEGFGLDGATLVQGAGKPDHKPGYDLTFSADKSVSVLFAAMPEERERLIAAHHAACDRALDYLQTQVHARRGRGGREHIEVEGLVIARFDHFASREVEPQLHSHHVVMNIAKTADGFSTFDQEGFMAHKMAAGALYRAEMANQLKQLGYGIRSERERDADGRETGHVWHRVAGIEKSTSDAFSTRRSQIETYMLSHGVGSQQACLATRARKDEPSFTEVMDLAHKTLDALRQTGDVTWSTAADLKALAPEQLEARQDFQMLRRLHSHESHFSKAQVVELMAKEHGGQKDLAAILREADSFLARNLLVELEPDPRGRARWASQDQYDLELDVGHRAARRQNDTTVRVPEPMVAQAIADHEKACGFALNEEQKRAVRFVTSGSGGAACLSGRAGTGKTSVCGGIVKAFEANGQKIIGTSTSWDAAQKLAAETGLTTYSTAALLSHLDKGTITLNAKSVVLVDEAGMVGARTIHALQRHLDGVGGKLVLVGDCLQLQPVESGAPFKMVIERTGDAMLHDIRRQSAQEDRALAQAFYGTTSGADLVAKMQERHQIKESPYANQAKKQLVADYLADTRPAADKLIIAPTNGQCASITEQLRAGLKARGELADSTAVEVRGKLLHEKQRLDLAVGDRVRFGVKDKLLGVVNGSQGNVTRIERDGDHHRLTVRLESEIAAQNGKEVTFSTRAFNALSHNYANTVHKAQGQGKAAVFWLADEGKIDRHLGLVAMTRMKQQLGVYTTPSGKAELARNLDTWRQKQNAHELAPSPTVTPRLQQALEQLAQRPMATPTITPKKTVEHEIGL